MDNQIINLIHKVKIEYGNDAYVGVSGDRKFENVSSNLRSLWGAFDKMSILTIDTYYYRTLADEYPDYTIKKFEEDVLDLLDALAHEFELINKANIEERRNSL